MFKINKDNVIHLLLGVIIGIFFTAASAVVLYKVIKSPQSLNLFEKKKQLKKSPKYKGNFGNKGFYLSFEKQNDINFFTPTEKVVAEISDEHATRGKHSLMVKIKPGMEAPGILWEVFRNDVLNWQKGKELHFDVFNAATNAVQLTIRLKSGQDYPKALYSQPVELQPLKNNHISIPLSDIAGSCNIKQMSYIKLYVLSPQSETVLFFDNLGIRESTKEDEVSNIVDSNNRKEDIPTKQDGLIKKAPPVPMAPDIFPAKNEVVTLDPKIYKDLGKFGQDWYVDSKKGSDENGNGSSLSPWKTIRKGIGRLKPGDALIISAGVYRERLDVSRNGTEERPILIGPKGDGEVIIDASLEIKDWEVYDKNRGIYQAACPFKPTAIVVDEQPFYQEFSLSSVNSGTWFYDSNKRIIYISIPQPGDPLAHEIGVISDDKNANGILVYGYNYLTFYGLTVKYAGGRGIAIAGSNNRIEKCTFKFNGLAGISVFSEGGVSKNNQVIKNRVYYNVMRNWQSGRYKTGGWGAGAGSGGASGTQFIGNIVHNNGGEGILAYKGEGGTVIKDNVVYDNWSVNIYIDNQPNGIIEKNLVFCHEPNENDLYNNGDNDPSDNKNFRRLRAIGIMTADENYGLNPPANNIFIANNIIIGCRIGISHYGQAQNSGLKNVLVAHNTIIVPNSTGIDEEYIGIKVPYNNGNNLNTIYQNNIVYASHPQTYLLVIETNPLGLGNNFTGVTFDHNIWYHSSREMPFHIGPKWTNNFNTDFKGWQKRNPADLYADPMLNDVSSYSAEGANLKSGSPAINAGLSVERVDKDYYNRPRMIENPTIGAVEFMQKNE